MPHCSIAFFLWVFILHSDGVCCQANTSEEIVKANISWILEGTAEFI